MPFLNARQSIMTLFEPIISPTPNPQQARLLPTELSFVKTHGILFTGQGDELEATMDRFLQLLDNNIGRSTRRWLEPGYHIGIANICALTGYSSESNQIAQAFKITPSRQDAAESQDQPMQEDTASEAAAAATAASPRAAACTPTSSKVFPSARRLFLSTYDIVCRRFGDPNILPFLHVTLAFLHHLTFCPDAIGHVAPHFPWKLTAYMLNTLIRSSSATSPASASLPHDVSHTLARLLEGEEWFPGWKGARKGEVQEQHGSEDKGQELAGAGAVAGSSCSQTRDALPLPRNI